MTINCPYKNSSELPEIISVFPLESVLLLPRTQLPLRIFEPRYLAMTDAAIGSHRLIGMIQPAEDADSTIATPSLEPVGCLGRITKFAETGDNRYMLTLTGICRFRVVRERASVTPYRVCHVNFDGFAGDFSETETVGGMDRGSLNRMLKLFEEGRGLKIDWGTIGKTTDETLVNALSMQMPFGRREKQALLEAPDFLARADILVAIAEMELAQKSGASSRLQ